jgi:glycosyltransferase involved in cell wall biosynthesis
MATDSFAVFILTHGRARNIKTYATLRKQGYTGPIYLIIDNEDDQADEYRRNYGDQVIQFDKAAEAARCDVGDNFPKRNTVLFARNASFQIARDLGVEYFLQLDDDYIDVRYRFGADLDYCPRSIFNLDGVFAVILDYYKAIPVQTIAMAQGGDYLGGGSSKDMSRLWLKRKAMNSFFCSVDRPFQFTGRMNDDVNTYVALGNRGNLFLTFFNVGIEQSDTQKTEGGLTDMYADFGTYAKSFYTVIHAPSCTNVTGMHSAHQRIHHRINWDAAVPKIMNERYRKAGHDGRTP